MKKLYCNGKKDYCPHFDGENPTNCSDFNCVYFDGSGCKITEEKFTNYDRILNMSIEELAAFCARNFGCRECEARELCREINSGDCVLNCYDNVKTWLESGAKQDK